MEQVIERLKEFWSRQSITGKALVAGLPLLLIIIGVSSIALLSHEPVEMALLSSDTEPADMKKIVEELEKQGIQMKLRNEGRDVYVPVEEIAHLRVDVSGLELHGAHIGWELLDKPKWGATQTEIDMDLQRALQGELARSIETDPRVAQANVIINMVEDDAFADEEKYSEATVTLTLAGNGDFGPREARTIQNLVASAVPNLSPEQVTVTDNLSRTLSRSEAKDGELDATASSTQLALKKQYEADLRQKIFDSLSGYGPNRVSAIVNVDLDFNKRKTQSENYSPVIGDRGIERHVEESRSKSSGSTTVGGVPGTASNEPGNVGLEGGSGGNDSSESKSSVDYEINKEVTEEVLAPGTVIKRCTAAVTIDTEELPEETRRTLVTQVSNAIGASAERGDKVSVIGMVFDPAARAAVPEAAAEAAAAREAGEKRNQTIRSAASWGIALLMIALLAVLMRSLVNQIMPREPALAGLSEFNRGVELDHEMGGADDGFVLKHLDDMSDSQTQKMRNEIERLIDTRPEVVAGLVRNWLLED